MIVKINNPYFDRSYKVVEDKGDVEFVLNNIDKGNQSFLHLHDCETGDAITISPACCASIEFTESEADFPQSEDIEPTVKGFVNTMENIPMEYFESGGC